MCNQKKDETLFFNLIFYYLSMILKADRVCKKSPSEECVEMLFIAKHDSNKLIK